MDLTMSEDEQNGVTCSMTWFAQAMEDKKARTDLEAQLIEKKTQMANDEVMLQALEQELKKMKADRVKTILEEVSRFELSDLHYDVRRQEVGIDWELLEEEVDFETLDVELQKRLFQQYAANRYSAIIDQHDRTGYDMWDELHPAFARDWLRPNGLLPRQGQVALSDITKAFIRHREMPDKSITWHMKNILFEEYKVLGKEVSNFVVPNDLRSWDTKLTELNHTLETYVGECDLAEYLNWSVHGRNLEGILRQAGVNVDELIFWEPGTMPWP